MTTQKNLLLIFTRNLERGKVKKRLAGNVGKDTALEIYQLLMMRTHEATCDLPQNKIVYYSDFIPEKDLWEHSVYGKKLQQGADLGERMKNAFQKGFEDGYKNIILIGSDLYDLHQQDLEKAFAALDDHDVVLGPAEDGGYYLIGMKSPNSAIFKNKTWGTSSVLMETLKDLRNKNIHLLKERNDIDTFEDIQEHPAFQQFIKRKI